MEKLYSPYVQKLIETIDCIDGKNALQFVEQLERVEVEELPTWIDNLYECKDRLEDVLPPVEKSELDFLTEITE